MNKSESMKRIWEKRRQDGFRFKERDVSYFIGKKFGRLTVTSLLPIRKKAGRVWLCTCECGRTKEVRTMSLNSGHVKSCGCLYKENTRKKLLPGESGLNHLYRNYIQRAKKRKINFSLTLKEFKRLTSENCIYCDSPPSLISKSGNAKDSYSYYYYNGLDRIDSSKDYTIDNVEPCCTTCNIMKWTLSKKNFLNHIKSIYENQRRRKNALFLS